MASITLTQPVRPSEIVYPESDGEPMADNTRQFRWIVTIEGGLDARFADDPWTPPEVLRIASVEPWEILLGPDRIAAA